MGSKDNFQRKLDLPGRRPRTADSTKCRTWSSGSVRENGRVRRTKIGSVEQVEKFRPELNVSCLGDVKVLHQRKIDGYQTRAYHGASTQISQCAWFLNCKGTRVQVTVRSSEHGIVIRPGFQIRHFSYENGRILIA